MQNGYKIKIWKLFECKEKMYGVVGVQKCNDYYHCVHDCQW